MTKEISLTRGQVTLVDYEFLLNFGHWCEQINLKTSYARTKINGKTILMHRFIVGKAIGYFKGDVDRNNQRSNLRVATRSQ